MKFSAIHYSSGNLQLTDENDSTTSETYHHTTLWNIFHFRILWLQANFQYSKIDCISRHILDM